MPRTRSDNETIVERKREITNGTRAVQTVTANTEPSTTTQHDDRIERIERLVLTLRKDVDELRYLFTRLNNAFMNGELQGYALQRVSELDQRVGYIESYLRYITTGSPE
jgi:DNA-binding transcriptional regulator GbsR (MarR family)